MDFNRLPWTHQLCHALVRLLLVHHVHPEMFQMTRKFRVHLGVVASVTINICQDRQFARPRTSA